MAHCVSFFMELTLFCEIFYIILQEIDVFIDNITIIYVIFHMKFYAYIKISLFKTAIIREAFSIKSKYNIKKNQFMEIVLRIIIDNVLHIIDEKLSTTSIPRIDRALSKYAKIKQYDTYFILYIIRCTCRRLNHRLKCIEGEQHPCRAY